MRHMLLLLALASCDRPVTEDPKAAAPAKATAKAEPPAKPEPPAKTDTPAKTDAPPKSEMAAKADTPAAVALDFDDDAVGGPAAHVEAVIGDWVVDEKDGARGLLVDGSRWRNGTPSANLADQAKRLYGERYAEFLDGVKAFAFFPLAVIDAPPPQNDVRISFRFYPVAGKIDQAAGIAFAIAPDGSYWGARANALEDNILFFRVVKGKRTILKTIRNTPTPSKTWHDFAVELRGTKVHVELDGKPWLDETLDAPPQGKIGLWSKADSQVLFDDVRVAPLR